MNRADRFALTAIAGIAIVLASWLTMATQYHVPSAAAASHPVVAARPVHMSLVLATPDMLGGEGHGPAYIPGNPVFPADTDVTVTVVNFDDATALAAGTERYAQAAGIKGSLRIETLDPNDPNAPGTVTTATSLDPAAGVSHTFTIPSLGLNVPIAPKAKTTFTFHTTHGGTYAWQCFDPCGGDPNGWGGPMATAGQMKGSVTVCASGCCC